MPIPLICLSASMADLGVVIVIDNAGDVIVTLILVNIETYVYVNFNLPT